MPARWKQGFAGAVIVMAGCAGRPEAEVGAPVAAAESPPSVVRDVKRAPDAPAPGVVRRIDLGPRLFEPGSATLAKGATETISARLAGVAAGSRLVVEVFADWRGRARWHQNAERAARLSQLRAEALGEYLTFLGYDVVQTTGRGVDEVDGGWADRRAEVVVVGGPLLW
jgi:hypothetical protein